MWYVDRIVKESGDIQLQIIRAQTPGCLFAPLFLVPYMVGCAVVAFLSKGKEPETKEPMLPSEFIKLPIEERRRILAEQAAQYARLYCARCGELKEDDVESDICGTCADDLRSERDAELHGGNNG